MNEEEILERLKPGDDAAVQPNPNEPARGVGKACGVIFFAQVAYPKLRKGGSVDTVVAKASRERAAMKYLRPMDEDERKLRGFVFGNSHNPYLLAELIFQNPEIQAAADKAGQPLRGLFTTTPEAVIGHHPQHVDKWVVRNVEPGIWAVIYDAEAGSQTPEQIAASAETIAKHHEAIAADFRARAIKVNGKVAALVKSVK